MSIPANVCHVAGVSASNTSASDNRAVQAAGLSRIDPGLSEEESAVQFVAIHQDRAGDRKIRSSHRSDDGEHRERQSDASETGPYAV
jgi:hypothetical protein